MVDGTGLLGVVHDFLVGRDCTGSGKGSGGIGRKIVGTSVGKNVVGKNLVEKMAGGWGVVGNGGAWFCLSRREQTCPRH